MRMGSSEWWGTQASKGRSGWSTSATRAMPIARAALSIQLR